MFYILDLKEKNSLHQVGRGPGLHPLRRVWVKPVQSYKGTSWITTWRRLSRALREVRHLRGPEVNTVGYCIAGRRSR
jgi:poly(3-hydroxyalkanoate) synthetase